MRPRPDFNLILRNVHIRAKCPIRSALFSGFCSRKRLGVFLLPPGWDASPSQGYPSIKFAGTQLSTWVERGTVKVKYLAKVHNTMSSARARTWTAPSGDERTNHEVTVPPNNNYDVLAQKSFLLVPQNVLLSGLKFGVRARCLGLGVTLFCKGVGSSF